MNKSVLRTCLQVLLKAAVGVGIVGVLLVSFGFMRLSYAFVIGQNFGAAPDRTFQIIFAGLFLLLPAVLVGGSCSCLLMDL